jgi:hypothetical protein
MLSGKKAAVFTGKLMPIFLMIHKKVSNITLTTLSILIIIIAIKPEEFGA